MLSQDITVKAGRPAARRLLGGVALLLGGGKLARQLRFRRGIGVIVISRVIVFPAMAIACLLYTSNAA